MVKGELTAAQCELIDTLLLRLLRGGSNLGLLGPLMDHVAHCRAAEQLQRGLCAALGGAVNDGQPWVEGGQVVGTMPSGTRVTAQWLPTHCMDVACARCVYLVVVYTTLHHVCNDRVTMARSEAASTWGLLVLNGELVHAEGFGTLLLGGVYGRLSKSEPCKQAYIGQLLQAVDEGWQL